MPLPCGARPPSRDGMREWVVACLTRPPHSAASGGRCSQHSPSAQPLPGWTLQSEVLMREAGTCFLLCACVCAWLGLGVPVLGDRGGEGWLRACGGCRCRVGQGLGCGCCLPQTSRVFSPTQGTRSEPVPLWCPAPPWSPRGSFSWAFPVREGQRQGLPTPALPRGSHGGLATVTVPRAGAWGFHLPQ